jgi:hypothetical protein
MSMYDIFYLNAKDYLDTVSDIPINIILLLVAVGLCAASVLINLHKTYTVRIIKSLLRKEATDEQNAKTLSELHIDNIPLLKRALSRDSQLTKIVKRVGYTAPTYEEYMASLKEKKKKEKIDFSTAKFLIPKENVDRAKLICEKENPTLLRTVLICLFIVAITVCIMMLMPSILTFISNNIPE